MLGFFSLPFSLSLSLLNLEVLVYLQLFFYRSTTTRSIIPHSGCMHSLSPFFTLSLSLFLPSLLNECISVRTYLELLLLYFYRQTFARKKEEERERGREGKRVNPPRDGGVEGKNRTFHRRVRVRVVKKKKGRVCWRKKKSEWEEVCVRERETFRFLLDEWSFQTLSSIFHSSISHSSIIFTPTTKPLWCLGSFFFQLSFRWIVNEK